MKDKTFEELINEIVNSINPIIQTHKSVCMCGSSKFSSLIAVIKWELEKRNVLATGLHLLPEWYFEKKGFEQRHHLAELENVDKNLDDIHLRKIDLSDCVYVCNYNNYIGERTAFEIEYAKKSSKPIFYLNNTNQE